MGYNIYIGNAVPQFNKSDFPYLSARWTVEPTEHPDAPDFSVDGCPTGNGNGRGPSYSVWTDFTKWAGLYEMFYNEDDGFLRPHPGCCGITVEQVQEVEAALHHKKNVATRPAGFSEDGSLDHNLARLMWLAFWMRWAVENCETPAIFNS